MCEGGRACVYVYVCVCVCECVCGYEEGGRACVCMWVGVSPSALTSYHLQYFNSYPSLHITLHHTTQLWQPFHPPHTHPPTPWQRHQVTGAPY